MPNVVRQTASPAAPRGRAAAWRGLLLATLGVMTGCANPGILVASSGAHRLSAHDKDSGISMVLTSGVWDSSPRDLTEHWTVLHVLIANLGTEPLLIAPGDLELRDSRGFHYELYDPGAVFEATEDHAEQGLYARDYHRNYDPGGPVEFEPIIPPGRVAEHALPWGVLEPGTQMRGFVYFERVEGGANAATLVWHALRPDHDRIADLQFDLHVARPKPEHDDLAAR